MRYIIPTLFIILINITAIASCSGTAEETTNVQNSSNKEELSNSSNDNKASNIKFDIPFTSFDPLTFEHFSLFLNGSEPFSHLSIDFTTTTENPYLSRRSCFQYGCLGLGCDLYYTEIRLYYKCSLVTYATNPYCCSYECDLTSAQMEPIISFIQQNNEYFFNNEEFNGLELPYLSTFDFIENNNYRFTLIITDSYSEQQDPQHALMISKSAEQLTPGTPLYELFQIWESQFVPELLQHEQWCD